MKNNSSLFASLAFALITIALYLYKFLSIPYELDSIYDEGFLFLCIQSAKSNDFGGVSLWASFSGLLPDLLTSNVYNLRVITFIVNLLSFAAFSFPSCIFLKRSTNLCKKFDSQILFISSTGLLYSFTSNALVVSYNQWQVLWFSIAIGSFLLSLSIKNIFFRFTLNVLVGLSLTLAFFTILPSAILVSLSLLFILIIKELHDFKRFLSNVAFAVLGIVIGLLLVQLFISPLNTLACDMLASGKSIISTNRGYDPMSFIINLILYLRDYIIVISCLVGITYLSKFTYTLFRNRYLCLLLYFFLLFTVCLYLKKPHIPISTLVSFPIVLLIITNTKHKITYKPLYLIYFILFTLPLSCAFGTNTYLGDKMIYFIFPLPVLFYLLINTIPPRAHDIIRYMIPLLLIVPVYKSIPFNRLNVKEAYQSALKGMKLNESQYNYYKKIDAILTDYSYNAERDFIWNTQLDAMTVVSFGGKQVGNYFQPMDYCAVFDKALLPQPDFLFINEFDYAVAGDTLKKYINGFPQEFDKYDIGILEQTDADYLPKRTLYCRKSKYKLK